MAGVIPEESRTGTQIFPVGRFGDSDADDREVLRMPFLNQAADEYVRDLGKRRMSVEYTLICILTTVNIKIKQNPPIASKQSYYNDLFELINTRGRKHATGTNRGKIF